MKPMKASEIRGNWATLLSAWNNDGSLDLGRIEHEIDVLVDSRVDGIYSNGTAGEFQSQTNQEFLAISKLLADKCDQNDMPYQLGVSHMSAQISLERLTAVKQLKPAAFQVILPDWFPVTDEESIDFLKRMEEEAGDIGLILYNPPHAKRVLRPFEIAKMKREVPNIIGIKTAAGDDEWYREMREHIPELSVFVPGHILADGILNGAHGAYSNMACLNPSASQRWTDTIFADIDSGIEQGRRIQKFMREFIAPFITEQSYSNASCDRFMARVGGWADVGEFMRWPYRSIPDSEIGRVREALQRLIPEFAKLR